MDRSAGDWKGVEFIDTVFLTMLTKCTERYTCTAGGVRVFLSLYFSNEFPSLDWMEHLRWCPLGC